MSLSWEHGNEDSTELRIENGTGSSVKKQLCSDDIREMISMLSRALADTENRS